MTTTELLNTCHGVNGQLIRRTKSDKIHVPATPVNGIQRCSRCHARIDGRISFDGPHFWQVGTPVLMRRSGSTIMTETQAATFRPCGRKDVAA